MPCRFFCFFLLGHIIPPFLISSIYGVSSALSQSVHSQTSFIAAPWSDVPEEQSNARSCAFSVKPVHAEDDLPRRGFFVQFKMGKNQYIAKASLFDGRFTVLEVFRFDVGLDKIRFLLVASTKFEQETLDIKAWSCTESEAYLVITIASEGPGSDGMLFLFTRSGPGSSLEDFVIVQSTELGGLHGVAAVSVTCYQENVIFAIAQSVSLLPPHMKKVLSSVSIWSPQSRSMVASLTVDTINAVSVVAFESGPCLMLVFGQASSRNVKGPLDTLVYCLSSASRTLWKINLIQAVNLCEVHGLSLFSKSQNELGVLVAVAKKAQEHELCPVAPLTMVWNGKEMAFSSNITIQNVAAFHSLPSKCCSLLLARKLDMERSLSVVGSTDVLFEEVRKFDIFTVEKRTFFLLSFTSNSQQSPLHEFLCGGQVGVVTKLIFGPGNHSMEPPHVRSSNGSEVVTFQSAHPGNVPEAMSASLLESPPMMPPLPVPPADDRTLMGSLPKSPPPVMLLKGLSPPRMPPRPYPGMLNSSGMGRMSQVPMIVPTGPNRMNIIRPALPVDPPKLPPGPPVAPRGLPLPPPNLPAFPVRPFVIPRNNSRKISARQLRPQNGTRKVVLNRRVPLTPAVERNMSLSAVDPLVALSRPELPVVQNPGSRVRRNLTQAELPRRFRPGLRNESGDFDVEEIPGVYLPSLTVPRIIPFGFPPKRPLIVPLRGPQQNRTIIKMRKAHPSGSSRGLFNRTRLHFGRPAPPFNHTVPRSSHVLRRLERPTGSRNLTSSMYAPQRLPLLPMVLSMTNLRLPMNIFDPRSGGSPAPYNLTGPGGPPGTGNALFTQNVRLDLARSLPLPQRRRPLKLNHGGM